MKDLTPITYAPGLDAETVGGVVLKAACMAVNKRLWKHGKLPLGIVDFKQEIAARITARVARFIPKPRKRGGLLTIAEYAYMAACFAMVDVLREHKRRGASGRVDALDAFQFNAGAKFQYDPGRDSRASAFTENGAHEFRGKVEACAARETKPARSMATLAA
jgi:hypothetical protein